MNALKRTTLAIATAAAAFGFSAPVMANGELVVYCNVQEEWCRPMVNAFEKATGIKVLAGVNYRDSGGSRNNLFIVAVSVVVGMMPLVNAQLFSRMPQWMSAFTHSGIVLAALTALLLNLYLNGQERKAAAGADARPAQA